MISGRDSNMNNSPRRTILGRVERYNGSTLIDTFLSNGREVNISDIPEIPINPGPWEPLPIDNEVEQSDATLPDITGVSLQEISIARAGDKGKFFGFGICQQATVKIIDKSNILTFVKGQRLKTSFCTSTGIALLNVYTTICPSFFIKDVKHDEKTSVYTLTAYDAIDNSTAHTFAELGIQAPYTIKDVTEACAGLLGLTVSITDSAFDLSYDIGANFDGSENLRTVLDAIAEATQTIYYVNHFDELVFKRLDKDGAAVLTVPKKDYFELTTALPATLTDIMSVTELGDNLRGTDQSGATQYVRDNPFWNARSDLNTVLQEAIARISGLTIAPHTIKWRGNFLTEIGDKLSLEAKDGSFIDTYILEDSFTYNGGFSQTGSWEYTPDSDKNVPSNPVTIDDKFSQTYAKVDKVNKRIDLVVSDVSNNTEAISALRLTADGIVASVQEVKETTDGLGEDVATLTQRVSAAMSSEDVRILIESELNNGVESVTTSTGFTFNEEGLTVSKSDSEMTTTITEDGMTVYRNDDAVLTANNTGVDATNLRATTYLVIGANSRIENYGSDRTGCFWIGPSSTGLPDGGLDIPDIPSIPIRPEVGEVE